MEFLKTKGKNIITESGTPVWLRGTCVGGWMNMENFINGFPGTEISLREHMRKRLGKRTDLTFSRK